MQTACSLGSQLEPAAGWQKAQAVDRDEKKNVRATHLRHERREALSNAATQTDDVTQTIASTQTKTAAATATTQTDDVTQTTASTQTKTAASSSIGSNQRGAGANR